MRIFAAVLVTLLAGPLAASTARAWSVGTDLSLAVAIPEEGETTTSLQLGGSPGVFVPILQPGLRVALTPNRSRHEVALSGGVSVLSGNSETLRQEQVLASYQYNFDANRYDQNIFLTAGPGLVNLGSEAESLTGLSLGGGVGVRVRFAEGHGGVRVEARYDRQSEMKHNGYRVIDPFNVLSVKVGFEVWN